MLKNPTFSDFTFIVKGKEFKVHKNILAEASPYFLTLFTTDVKKSRRNESEINNIEPDIFGYLLDFTYGGDLPENISQLAKALCEAAHIYCLDDLKKICEQEFYEALSVENALEIYNWAWLYDVDDLKMKAWEIIKRDIMKVYVNIEKEPLEIKDIEEYLEQKQKWMEIRTKLIGSKSLLVPDQQN